VNVNISNNPMERANQVRELVTTYLTATNMASADFARRIGYKYSSLHGFLSGRVRNQHGDPRMCEAILDFLDKNPVPDQEQFVGKLYETAALKTMRDVFQRLVAKPCILMLYAPPGSGKTNLAKSMIASVSTPAVSAYRIYCTEEITPRDLMREIAYKCGSPSCLSTRRTVHNLRFDFQRRRAILYFDEAQHLEVRCLETVRELYDEMNWSLCFAGSHTLDNVFSRFAGDLEQLERRITERIYLPALTNEEAVGIAKSEVPGLDGAAIRKLIDSCTVDVRAGKQSHRYISVGRIMTTIQFLQEAAPERAEAPDPAQKVEAVA
jgi:DNA transposition AAA+ family ATPase